MPHNSFVHPVKAINFPEAATLLIDAEPEYNLTIIWDLIVM